MERPAKLRLQGRARPRAGPCVQGGAQSRAGRTVRGAFTLRSSLLRDRAGWILELREAPAHPHRHRRARPRSARRRRPARDTGADGRRLHRTAGGPPVAQRDGRAVRGSSVSSITTGTGPRPGEQPNPSPLRTRRHGPSTDDHQQLACGRTPIHARRVRATDCQDPASDGRAGDSISSSSPIRRTWPG